MKESVQFYLCKSGGEAIELVDFRSEVGSPGFNGGLRIHEEEYPLVHELGKVGRHKARIISPSSKISNVDHEVVESLWEVNNIEVLARISNGSVKIGEH